MVLRGRAGAIDKKPAHRGAGAGAVAWPAAPKGAAGEGKEDGKDPGRRCVLSARSPATLVDMTHRHTRNTPLRKRGRGRGREKRKEKREEKRDITPYIC